MSDAEKVFRPVLLREDEVARRLRCTPKHVQKLRLQRKLAYIRGRPVTIEEKDIEIYVAWAKVRRVRIHHKVKAKTPKFVSAGASPKPFSLLTRTEAAAKFGRSPSQIRYLCLRGHVPFILGRPPLIDEFDLTEYFEQKRLAALARIPPEPGSPEFEARQKEKAEQRMYARLHTVAVRRKVARILADRAARIAAGAFVIGAPRRKK